MTIAPSGGKPGTCPICGAENAPGSRFCERCGTRLPPASREVAGPTPAAPADATLTFDRPLVGTPREEQGQERSATVQPTPPEQETPAARATAARTANEADDGDPVSRDAPTMNFDLPNLPAPEAHESRNAATLSFDLPSWAEAGEPEAPATRATEDATVRAAPAPSEKESPTAETAEAAMKPWDYQPWTPQSPEERGATAPRELEGTRPAVVLPTVETTGYPNEGAAATGAVSPQAPSQPHGNPVPSDRLQAQPPGSGWYGSPAPTPTQGQGGVTYPTPSPAGQGGGQFSPNIGTPGPPAYGHPQGGATTWSPPNTGAYPASAVGNSNRTLWIILGVVGGLLLLCAMICVLIFLVGVASAAGTGAVATGVATTTRP